jgi:hypothetical protein
MDQWNCFNFLHTPYSNPTMDKKGSLAQRSNRLSYGDTTMKYPKRRWSIPFANGHRHNNTTAGGVAICHMREVAGSTPGLDFYILCEPICVSLCLFHCTLCKQLVFYYTLKRKGSVGRSCRATGSKIISCGMVHQGISCRVLRGATYDPGHWTFYFRRGFGLVVSVIVPSMLAVLPYARGRGFDSRSRLL